MARNISLRVAPPHVLPFRSGTRLMVVVPNCGYCAGRQLEDFSSNDTLLGRKKHLTISAAAGGIIDLEAGCLGEG